MSIKQQDLTNAILALAGEQPDFVYPFEWNERREPDEGEDFEPYYSENCEYRHPEDPENRGACIIGQAVFRIGQAGILPERGYTLAASIVLDGHIGTEADEGYLGALNSVQSNQDMGIPWGQAVLPLRNFEAAHGR